MEGKQPIRYHTTLLYSDKLSYTTFVAHLKLVKIVQK